MKLLTKQAGSPKLAKSLTDTRYLSAILYMAPANLSGINLCPGSSPGCRAACLNTAGRGVMGLVKSARLRKALLFIQSRALFMSMLQSDIELLRKQSRKQNKSPVIRLNGTTDINWLAPSLRHIIDSNQDVQFYDYTKVSSRLYMSKPSNYHLTLSRSETNEAECLDALRLGFNVAVVFSKELPKTWNDFRVIDGNNSDYRFLDPIGVVVGLTAKGKAKKDKSGVVVSNINNKKEERYQNETQI